MAKSLNRSRVRYTQLGLVAAALILFSRQAIPDGSPLDELMDVSGNFLVIACVLGRLYSTTFIGGRKNEALVTTGPFSLCRNPLYFSSFLGAFGIGLMSSHLVLMVSLPLLFLAVYFPLINREEKYLLEHFGAEFEAYAATTPKFIPNFSKYRVADSLEINIRFLHKALKDCILWLCAFPLFELIEYGQNTGVIPMFFTLP